MRFVAPDRDDAHYVTVARVTLVLLALVVGGVALMLPVLLVLESGSHRGALLALLSLGVGRLPIQQILRGTEGIELNQTLALTGKFLLLYSLLLALGWLLG